MQLKFPCAAILAAILLASQAASAGEVFPRIVVTVAPLKPYVDEILRGQGTAENLLRPGQEPHDFALTIKQAQMLDKADIIIVPDLGMSPFLKRLLAKNKTATIIELSKLDGADALPYAHENPWIAKMKELPTAAVKHEHTHIPKPIDAKKMKPEEVAAKPDEVLTDPHLWLDPERMAAIALPLASEIAGKVPHARHELLSNARTLSTHLRRDVIPAMRELLGKPSSVISAVNRPEIPFITYHAAYQYFMGRFKLTHYGEITSRPELKMGASSTATMLGGAESLHIRCLIGEEKDVLMMRIAKSSGARIILLSPEQVPERKNVDALDWIENDYDRLLYVTAKAFSGCL